MADASMTTKPDQDECIRRALAAASVRDAHGMLTALHESMVLDGLVQTFRMKWPTLDHDEIDFVVAGAVDVLYQRVADGENVLNLIAYLWKVSDRRASDRHQQRLRESNAPDERLEASVDNRSKQGVAMLDPDADWDRRRLRAVSIARSLLPRLGQENLQRVMEFVLDAVEAGREDIHNSEIADALGLKLGTVRTSLSRAFARLARIAREENLIDQSELSDLWVTDPEDELGD